MGFGKFLTASPLKPQYFFYTNIPQLRITTNSNNHITHLEELGFSNNVIIYVLILLRTNFIVFVSSLFNIKINSLEKNVF